MFVPSYTVFSSCPVLEVRAGHEPEVCRCVWNAALMKVTLKQNKSCVLVD